MTKGRESGMPDTKMWQGFFDPARILDRLDCDHPGNVVEFGCGYGLFTVEAAKRASGTVYAVDIDPGMLAATMAEAGKAGVANVLPMQRDFVTDGTGLPTGSCDYAMAFNLLHIDEEGRSASSPACAYFLAGINCTTGMIPPDSFGGSRCVHSLQPPVESLLRAGGTRSLARASTST